MTLTLTPSLFLFLSLRLHIPLWGPHPQTLWCLAAFARFFNLKELGFPFPHTDTHVHMYSHIYIYIYAYYIHSYKMWHIYGCLASEWGTPRKNCVKYYTYRVSYVGQAATGKIYCICVCMANDNSELFEAIGNILTIVSILLPLIGRLNFLKNIWERVTFKENLTRNIFTPIKV